MFRNGDFLIKVGAVGLTVILGGRIAIMAVYSLDISTVLMSFSCRWEIRQTGIFTLNVFSLITGNSNTRIKRCNANAGVSQGNTRHFPVLWTHRTNKLHVQQVVLRSSQHNQVKRPRA